MSLFTMLAKFKAAIMWSDRYQGNHTDQKYCNGSSNIPMSHPYALLCVMSDFNTENLLLSGANIFTHSIGFPP